MARIYNEQVAEPLGTSTEHPPRICIPISEPIDDESIDEPISEPQNGTRKPRSMCDVFKNMCVNAIIILLICGFLYCCYGIGWNWTRASSLTAPAIILNIVIGFFLLVFYVNILLCVLVHLNHTCRWCCGYPPQSCVSEQGGQG